MAEDKELGIGAWRHLTLAIEAVYAEKKTEQRGRIELRERRGIAAAFALYG
jgi:hypothetical protein